jgi:O-antigen ligase
MVDAMSSTASLTVPDAPATPATPVLDRLAQAALLAFVASVQISIAAAGILLTVTFLCWIAVLVRDRARPAAPSSFVLLGVYAAATLVSAAFSISPEASVADSKQLVLFALVPAVFTLARGRRAATVVDVVIAVGAASAAYGVIQYAMFHYDNLGQRPQGALTHYMTYSGVLMLVVCAALARVVFGTRDRAWPALVMPALVAALSLTLGRSAWVGTSAAVALLLGLKDFRLTAFLPLTVAAVLALAPDTVTSRMMSMFDLQDPSNRDRVAMLKTGVNMVTADPLTGVGPNMVPRAYPTYRDASAVEAVNPHLHNVPMQIAAERGLPALAIWLGFIAILARALYRLFRSAAGTDRVLPATGLAAIAAMLAAGLFEYNFGDSEFLMLFLVLVTLPFAASRAEKQ